MHRLHFLRFALLAALPGWFGSTGGAQGPPPDDEPRYDIKSVVDLEGTVGEATEVKPPNRLSGVHLRLRVEGEEFDVYLGPSGYVLEFDSTFKKGSRVQVIGSKVKFGTTTIVLARELRNGGTTLYLRERSGRPYWDSKGRRVS